MDGIVNLTPDDPRAKEAIIGLIGSTFAQLKEIDNHVVGSSSNIKALKTDVKSMITDIIKPNAPQHVPPPVAPPPPVHVAPTFVAPTHTVVAAGINVQPTMPVQQEDPDQLVFDFNKKITPDTINDKLDRILDKLDRIIELSKT
ncbi:hypothetical protein EBR43_04850 [bacterium]|nr:hypothetical protein [bacterium]